MPKIDPTLERYKDRGWREIAAIDAALERGEIDEQGWHDAMAKLITPPYLAATSLYAQAGHGGDAMSWEASRGFVADALSRSGTFLDVGCASGVMMESVVQWGAVKNLIIEPYGLDIVAVFVERTRLRLPQWADRIYEGNVRTWTPPDGRFDYVLIRPVYAPAQCRIEMVRHVLDSIVKPDGRLIVLAGSEEVQSVGFEGKLVQGGLKISGRVEILHTKDARLVRRLFWIDGAQA